MSTRTLVERFSFLCLVLFFSALGAAGNQQPSQEKRVPSTPAQRAKFVEFARQLEADPLSKDAQGVRAAAIKWLIEVPDIKVEVCSLLPDLLQSKKNYSTELFGQTVISAGAFVAANPDLSNDHLLVNTAGVVGALKAYQSVLKQHPEAKWPMLDELLRKSGTGEIQAYVQDATVQCKQMLVPDDEGKPEKIAAANDHLNHGDKFFDEGQYQLALIEYGRAATLIPDQHNAYHELSQTYYELKNYDKAVEYAQRALRLNPKCWLCYQSLGNIYDDSGKPEEALAQFGKAAEIAPNSGHPLYNSALTLNRLHREAEAITALQKAVEVDPQYASPHRLLGLLLAQRGELWLARMQLATFVSIEKRGDRFDKVSRDLNPAVHLAAEKVKQGDPQVDAYAAYGVTRAKWMTDEYPKRHPSATVYKRTAEEEFAALKSEAEKWREIKEQKPAAQDAQLDRLVLIYQAGQIEAFVFTSAGDQFQKEFEDWKQANPLAVQGFREWAAKNSISIDPIPQPVRVEWLGSDH